MVQNILQCDTTMRFFCSGFSLGNHSYCTISGIKT